MQIYFFNRNSQFIQGILFLNLRSMYIYIDVTPRSCETSVVDDAARKNDTRQMHVRLRERYWIIMKQITSSFIIKDGIQARLQFDDF